MVLCIPVRDNDIPSGSGKAAIQRRKKSLEAPTLQHNTQSWSCSLSTKKGKKNVLKTKSLTSGLRAVWAAVSVAFPLCTDHSTVIR